MKVSYVTVLLGVVAVAAAALAYSEYRQLAQMRSEGLTVQERGRLQKVAWDAEKQVHHLQTQLSAARVLHSDEEDAKPGADNKAALGQAAADYLARMDDPEVRRLTDLQRLANLNRAYGQFFRDAHLSPEQVQKFQQLMLERQRAETDVLAAAADQGINPMSNPTEFRQMVRAAQADVDKQIQQSLGSDGYQQFQQFQQGQNQRGVVNQLQADLSYTDAPLSDQQKAAVLQIVQSTNRPGGNAISAKTLNQAQGVLSAQQFQALQNIQKLQVVNSQLSRLMSNHPAPPHP